MVGKDVRRVCVIGAGTMGAGIAAHLANQGFEVSLLDQTPELAHGGLDRAKATKPPHFYTPEQWNAVHAGPLDPEALASADWICEAIIEDLPAKQKLFALVEAHAKPDAWISTNTSGLQIELLTEGRSKSFQSRFLGTHFFNPPRYLKLLELIPSSHTEPGVAQEMASFLEARVGRRVVTAKDTPGFIANRFGMWSMIHAIHAAEKLQLSIEQVDAITGPFLGRPKSASFRLNDLVGIDVMASIAANQYDRCEHDPQRHHLKLPRSMRHLLEHGWLGAKKGQGYYRRSAPGEFLALDLQTLAYRDAQDVDLPALKELGRKPLGERVAAALELRDEVGEFLREHLVPALRYADQIREEVSHSVEDFDRVMQWGFGWEMGPFALIDAIGGEKLGIGGGAFFFEDHQRGVNGAWVERKSEPQYRTMADYPVLSAQTGFDVRDLGEGVEAVAINTKMGTLNPEVVRSLREYADTRQGPTVLGSIARSFSAGFDLRWFLDRAEAREFEVVEQALIDLQELCLLLSTKPWVAAIYGHCLGGGFEIAVSCPLILAHPETHIGLPEAKVGLLPAGAGTTRLRLRYQSNAKALASMAKTLTFGVVGAGAEEAKRLGYLRPQDRVAVQPDALVTLAREAALAVRPLEELAWQAGVGPVVGMIDREQEEAKRSGELTSFDERIGDEIKTIFARATSREDALARERSAFLSLLSEPHAHARIRTMLESGKPLRN